MLRKFLLFELLFGLWGCATQPPQLPIFICLTNPDWRYLAQPPENADLLYGLVAKHPSFVDAPSGSRDYWFKSSQGELRLCRQRADAPNFCGSANVTFARVEDRWQSPLGVVVPTCGG